MNVPITIDPKDDRRRCCDTQFGVVHADDCTLRTPEPTVKPKPLKRECCDSFVGHAHARTCVVRWGDGL